MLTTTAAAANPGPTKTTARAKATTTTTASVAVRLVAAVRGGGRDQRVSREAGRLEVLHMTRGTVPKLLLTVLVRNLCFSLTLQRAISISTAIKHYVQRLWLQIEVVMSVQ